METTSESNGAPPSTEAKEVRLVDVPITTHNDALNIMVSFVAMAQKRGAFSLEESAKIWECVKFFRQ
jgi:hypothetical protein